MAATHRMRMNIVKDLRAFLWRVSFLGLLGVGAWLSLNHVSEGQPAPSKSRTPQQIVADLGILREATNMGRFAPSCDAQINAVIGLGENVRPLLLEGLNDKNLLMVANCSRCLVRMKLRLTEPKKERVRKSRTAIIAMMSHGPGWKPSNDSDYKEWIKFGEHRFAVTWIDQLLRK
jgi:hypothetical protein